jgi:hypothetical protein
MLLDYEVRIYSFLACPWTLCNDTHRSFNFWYTQSERSDKLQLTRTGTGGLPELREALDDSKASFAYARVSYSNDKQSTREKFILVVWIGHGCKVMRKAKVSRIYSVVDHDHKSIIQKTTTTYYYCYPNFYYASGGRDPRAHASRCDHKVILPILIHICSPLDFGARSGRKGSFAGVLHRGCGTGEG